MCGNNTESFFNILLSVHKYENCFHRIWPNLLTIWGQQCRRIENPAGTFRDSAWKQGAILGRNQRFACVKASQFSQLLMFLMATLNIRCRQIFKSNRAAMRIWLFMIFQYCRINISFMRVIFSKFFSKYSIVTGIKSIHIKIGINWIGRKDPAVKDNSLQWLRRQRPC